MRQGRVGAEPRLTGRDLGSPGSGPPKSSCRQASAGRCGVGSREEEGGLQQPRGGGGAGPEGGLPCPGLLAHRGRCPPFSWIWSLWPLNIWELIPTRPPRCPGRERTAHHQQGVEAPGPGSPRGVSVEHLPSLHAGLGAGAPAAHTRADMPASGQRLVVPSSSPRTRHGPPAPPASGERAASQPRPDQPPCPQAGPRADSPQDTVHTDRAPGCGQADLSLGLGTGLPSKPVPAPTAPGPLRVLGPSPSTPPWSPPRTCPPPGNPPLPLTSPEDLSVFQTQNMPH